MSASTFHTRPGQGPGLVLGLVIGLVLFAPVAQARQQSLYTASTPSLAERQRVTQTVVRYLATWNERDPQRRRIMLAEVLTSQASYGDPNRQGAGHDQLDTLIGDAQKAFPGYSLRLVSTIDLHHQGYVRFSWAAGGTPDAPI